MKAAPLVKKGYRSEIQGLRGVAIILVVVYHLWVGKPSGGIDVFLMMSGFFLIGSFAKQIRNDSMGSFHAFTSKVILRLFPPSAVVLITISIATLVVLPSLFWEGTVREIIASTLYYENWYLAFNSKDYLAAGSAVTPLQHFWSLSIQGQLYIFFFSFMAATGAILGYFKAKRLRNVFILVFILFVVSFAYAIYAVEQDQTYAYFNTFARVWEFTFGGVVALLMPKLRLSKTIQFVSGWVGLIALLLCGVFLDTAVLFPGYWTLWPILATALMLLSVESNKYSVHCVLRFKPLIYIGDISYSLFLWHWPFIIFYLVQTGEDEISATAGIAISLVSVALAALTTLFIEEVFVKRTLSKIMAKQGPLRVAVAISLIVLVIPSATFGYVKSKQDSIDIAINDPDHPGALALTPGFKYQGDEDVDVIPNHINSLKDVPDVYNDRDDCLQESLGTKVLSCRYGSDNPKKVIALIGGSHSAMWLPTLQTIIETEEPDWQIVTFIKSNCPLALKFEKEQTKGTCNKWNLEAIEEVKELKPDLIFTTSTRSTEKHGDETPTNYEDAWRLLDKAELNIFAIRDATRFPFRMPECVAKNGYDSTKCTSPRKAGLDQINPTKAIEKAHKNVYFADLSDYICEGALCKPVIGNVLTFRDSAHLTATYAKTLAPMMYVEIVKAFERFEVDDSD